ncbi:hypothetical protein CEXT_473721 [Caerostris extrusa]|uniref:Uncharacterized protein n=1 Tax=Caerostris extrusa TaxID=172846 RepID=A0AAV4YBN9_CAEEX|nr:hypothetical protein CEXT_473721 [Caerostris extrusa]
MADSWLTSHSAKQSMVLENFSYNSPSTSTSFLKISPHELVCEAGLSRSILNTTFDGIRISYRSPFPGTAVVVTLPGTPPQDVRALDERELIFELIHHICDDFELRRQVTVSYSTLAPFPTQIDAPSS